MISNNSKAKGLYYANKYKINKKIINYLNIKKLKKIILFELEKNKIDLICLAGFMKILTSNFIKKFNGKIINIHPSLLPKYKGLNTYQRAIDNKEKFSGCTVHYVNSKLDSGKIILQKKLKFLRLTQAKNLPKEFLNKNIFVSSSFKKILANL